MKFACIVRHSNDDVKQSWREEYDRPTVHTLEEAERWSKETVARFNATLRENERPRTLMSVEKVADESDQHQWEKTNLVTVKDRNGLYDKLICLNCGVTAKRYGLDNFILDLPWRRWKDSGCATVQARQKRRQP